MMIIRLRRRWTAIDSLDFRHFDFRYSRFDPPLLFRRLFGTIPSILGL